MKKTIIVFADILLVILALSLPHVTSMMIEGENECYFFKNGIICPSCGGTRCVYSFFTGNFKEALLYNFCVFCGLLVGIALLVLLNVYVFFKSEYCMKIIRWTLHPITLVVLVIAYMVLGLARNFF